MSSVSSESVAIDLSGAPVSDPAPVAPAPIPQQTVESPVTAVGPTLTKELAGAVDGIVHDLSGLTLSGLTVGDLLRHVPRFASLVHTLQIRGPEKREMVMAASHVLVDRVIPESDRSAGHALVDTVFPAVIAGVIDVVKGRVTFEKAVVSEATTVAAAAVSNPVVVAEARNCLSRLFAACIKK